MIEKCLIVDGNNLLYSSYHVSQKLPWKMKKGTIFFFLRVMISILKKTNYQKLLITFDGGGTNFRKTLLLKYKAQRPHMPKELWEQMQELKLLLAKINLPYLQLIDCEADDLIASFINESQKTHPHAIFDIFTRDKDLLQMLDENTNVLKYINGKISLYTHEQFFQEYHFLPKNYVDYLSLLGDNSDNIAGVRGIGPVNAQKLIQEFQTVENIYQVIANLPESNKILLENKQELVFINKKIISLEKNISLPTEQYQHCDFNWKEWKNNSELRNFCEENRFNSILKLLD